MFSVFSLKHFVSERKYDEELGRVARFTCDLDVLKKSIASFGQGERAGSHQNCVSVPKM